MGGQSVGSKWLAIDRTNGRGRRWISFQYGPSYNSLVNGQSYLWAYASGGGLQEYIGNEVTFNGADNIGTTQTYAAGNLGGVFNMSFDPISVIGMTKTIFSVLLWRKVKG